MRVLTALAIFVLALLADLPFTPQPAHLFNPQEITRLGLAWSIGEGHLDIDRFAAHTKDRAEFNGHSYADKQPGQSILAVPAVLFARAVIFGADPFSPPNLYVYLLCAATVATAIPSALAIALLFLLCLRLGAGRRNSLFAAAALGLGTPFFGWSTVLFGHVLAGSMLLASLALALWDGRASWRLPATGLLLGLLMVVDLTQAPAAAIVALLAASRGNSWRGLPWLILAGVVGVLPLLVYNALAFGSPFHLGYSDVVGFEGMKQGFFGLTLPAPAVLWELLFGLYRGLLPLSPVLVLLPIGLVGLWSRDRPLAIAIMGVIVAALLINSSYFYWDGGSSTGPRHLVAMLPIAAIALAFVSPPSWRGGVVAASLLILSIVISAICVSTNMLSGAGYKMPFFQRLLPTFIADPARVLPLLLPWTGFALLLLWPDRHKLPAGPLDAAGEVKL